MYTSSIRRQEDSLLSETGAYGSVAAEYYDSTAHPTCAAFGLASRNLIKSTLSRVSTDGMRLLEIGAGRSVLLESLEARAKDAASIVLTDQSEEMLRYSDEWHLSNMTRRIIAAEAIHRLGMRFDIVVASLGDAYNTGPFWSALARVLAPEGLCIYTTPSYVWARAYRSRDAGERTDFARFDCADGTRRYLPSFIRQEVDQRRLIEGSDLVVGEYRFFLAGELTFVPPKLNAVPRDAPIVEEYVVYHAQRRGGAAR